MNTRQRQAVLEGKLTLQNTINTGENNLLVDGSSTFLDRYDEDINRFETTSRFRNAIRYQIFSSPESPSIRLIQDGEEVSVINLNSSSTVSTTIEIISPHPITVFRGISVINTTRIIRGASTPILRTRSYSLDDNSDAVNNFLVSRDYPIFSSDGNYHYFMTLEPTGNNSVGEPLKLGDLSIVSRIYDASSRPKEWVVINDGDNSLSLLKILLRTDSPRIIDIDLTTSRLPLIKDAIPGTAYILSSDSNYYYVAPDYGLVREVQDQSLFGYINSSNKYYYQQNEIDDLFGVAEKKISVIQNGAYYYKLVRLGNTSGILNFLGETRDFKLYKVSTETGSQSLVENSNYSIIDIVNCKITPGSNDGEFSLIASSRIQDYSPYSLSDPYYTSLIYPLPVSSCVRINSTGTGDMKTVGNYLQFRGGSSVEKSILKLDSEPILGTSGQGTVFNNIYYKDNITGLYKFIPTIETYKKTTSINSPGLIDFNVGDGYTTYLCENSDWSMSSINTGISPNPNLVINNLINEKKAKYGSDAVLTGYLSTSNLPTNTDDNLLEAEEWTNYTGSLNLTIPVDDLPNIVMLSTSDYKIGYKLKAGGSQGTEVTKVYRIKEDPLSGRVKYLKSNPSWKNFSDIEKLYHSLGIASKNNGYIWESDLRVFIYSETNNTPMCNPDTWNPAPGVIPKPAITAKYDNFGDSYYLWSRKDFIEEGDLVAEVSSLPVTKGETNNNIWYHYKNHYYKATNSLYTCKLKPQYSIVALNKSPERYNSQGIYMKGDLVQYFYDGINYTFKSKIENNEGNPIPLPGTSNTYWEYVGDIKEYSTANVKYKYYEVDIKPLESISDVGTVLPNLVDSNSPTYFGLKYDASDSKPRIQKYYRKGFDFEVNDLEDTDHGTWKEGDNNTAIPCNNRIFQVTPTIGGPTYYYQLKRFATDVVIPDDYETITDTSLKNSNIPGNIVLKGDSYGCGFGKDKINVENCFYGSILYDFNQYKIRHQVFDENINYTQRSISSGLVSNFSGSYKLYLSNDSQNTIEIHIRPEDTEVSGFIGVYNLNSQISPSSSGTGIKPDFLTVQGTSTVTLDTPVLDGNDTPNFKASFPENTGDQDIVREYKFSTSDGIFSSSVYLRVIQGTNPGEVRPTKRTLYFLSNGVPYDTSFIFSSNIQNLNLQNVQIINDYGEDMLDRSENGAYIQEINNSTTYSTYSAFLKLKPNTRNEVFNNFRIKIGRVSGDTVTDRTLDENTAKFYKLIDDEWILLDDTYQPTYKEPYFTELPEIDKFNSGDVICICSSLRGFQGYYSMFLYSSSNTAQNNLMWKESTNLNNVISDLVTLNSGATIDLSTVNIITNEINLPDIKTMKEVGIIYKIENTYYYTFATRITSDYTYGNLNLPNYISKSRNNSQKYHLEILQREYDNAGNLTNEIDVHNLLGSGENYNISDTTWTLYGTDDDNELVDISGENTCSSDIIFSDTSSTNLIPYFRNSYDFTNYTVSGLINIKTILNLKLKYNNVSGISMDEEYRWVNYLFTLYTRWSNS